MKPVTRIKVNILIDIIMFVCMIGLAVIGFIIRYVLISGAERWEKYGENMELTIWGLDRHQWGYIHLLTGILLVILLVLHILFHWKQVVCMIKKLIPRKKMRVAIVSSLVVFSAFIMVLPFFIPVEKGAPIRTRGGGNGKNITHNKPENRSGANAPAVNGVAEHSLSQREKNEHEGNDEHQHHESRSLDIKGHHTIGGMARTYHVSANEMKRKLGIPSHIPDNERLGRIRRQYGFTMHDVEDCILELRGKDQPSE